MTAPLCDSRGRLRYFIGAQVDVSGLVKGFSDMESLERLVVAQEHGQSLDFEKEEEDSRNKKDEFQELSEMLNMKELDTVRRWGGRMHREQEEVNVEPWKSPRVLISDNYQENLGGESGPSARPRIGGRLSGIYENYLLVRPYPSLHILFASPTLRIPGILQSPFLSRIGGNSRVIDELTQAFANGRGVTAKIRWLTKLDTEGRNRWIHCTPLLGSNGGIGVWMIVIVDDEKDVVLTRRFRQAPPVDPRFGRTVPMPEYDNVSLRDFAVIRSRGMHGSGSLAGSRAPSIRTMGSDRPGSSQTETQSNASVFLTD